MIRGVVGAMVVGLAMWASPVWPKCRHRRRPRHLRGTPEARSRISYVEPKNPAHRPIYERLQKRRVLEDFRDFLSPLKLPDPLTIKIEG